MNCVQSQKPVLRTGVLRVLCYHSNVESCGLGEDYHGIYLDHQEVYF